MRHATAGILAGLCVSVCFAQDDAVVITATRFPEDVRRLPASVTVIGEEEIAKSPARTIPELLNSQAGFTMKDLFGNNASNTSIDLRGFGATGPQNTLILLDGRRLNDIDLSGVQWSAIPLSSIERIEILRGTGAVLYGDNASTGVVNIVTRSPLRQGSAVEAFGRAGSYRTVEGQLSGSFATDRLGVNGSVYGYSSDGYRANNRNEQQNNALNARLALGEGALDLRLGTDRQDVRLPGGRLIQPSIGLDEYAADRRGAQTPLDFASRDGARVGVSLMQRFGEAEFSVGVDYRDKDQRSFFDFSGFPSSRADKLDFTSLTPRLRLPFNNHTLVLGADWNSWRYRSRRADRPENFERPANRVTVAQDTAGYYVQDTVELSRATLVTLGWRGERAKYAGDDQADLSSPACFFCNAAPSVRETQKEHAWEVGVRHALGPQLALFGRAGRSFRFVNAEEIYENDVFFAPQFQILRPQHALTHEAGVEWRAGGNALRATLFRSDVSNEIHLDPFSTGVGNTNLPPSRREGVELDGSWQATGALRFTGGYAYTDARFREGTLAGSPFAIGTNLSIAGKTVPLVPRHKLNLGISWDMLPRTLLSGALTAVSEQVMDNDEPNTLGRRIPAYSVADVKLAQSFAWGRLAAALNNVFDQKYYTYAVRSAFIADRYALYPLPGRTLSLTAEVALR
ncbi:MAG TPA: TonB-dependent receptor [Burkholderiales bacterium]|nr:TonB-dependent receptor [Burkholderiales bacterium]